jgi:hypothetical protein
MSSLPLVVAVRIGSKALLQKVVVASVEAFSPRSWTATLVALDRDGHMLLNLKQFSSSAPSRVPAEEVLLSGLPAAQPFLCL